MGTDPNRNFDFQWATVGSSDEPCSETFHGSEPFSEVETRNVRDFVMPIREVNGRITNFGDSNHDFPFQKG